MGVDEATAYQFIYNEIRPSNQEGELVTIGRIGVSITAFDQVICQFINWMNTADKTEHFPNRGEIGEADIYDITSQMWMVLTKAVTNLPEAASSFNQRHKRFSIEMSLASENRLSTEVVTMLAGYMNRDISIRLSMINFIIRASNSNMSHGITKRIVGKLANFFTDQGLTPYIVTKKFGLEPKTSFLACKALRSDINYFVRLVDLYVEVGPLRRFMVIYDHPEREKFTPSNYINLFSFALGYARSTCISFRDYNYAAEHLNEHWIRIGELCGSIESEKTSGSDLKDIGVTEEEHRRNLNDSRMVDFLGQAALKSSGDRSGKADTANLPLFRDLATLKEGDLLREFIMAPKRDQPGRPAPAVPGVSGSPFGTPKRQVEEETVDDIAQKILDLATNI